MKKFNLNIAGYNISMEASEGGPELVLSPRFTGFISDYCEPDILINIHAGKPELPVDAVRIFNAAVIREISGIMFRDLKNFWSVWKDESFIYIKSALPFSPASKNATLKFSLNSRQWDLWIESPEKEVDPLDYPVDGLILYYTTVIHGDIFIHASGINKACRGYIFSGISGKGKSTMAKLWENSGAKIVHDDRLILRHSGDHYRMYNTPVYNNDKSRESILSRIFIIEHDVANRFVPVKGAAAVSMVMANCIQHGWGSVIIERLINSVTEMCEVIPVAKLYFKPDPDVLDQITKYG
jgi:hypothetical protein